MDVFVWPQWAVFDRFVGLQTSIWLVEGMRQASLLNHNRYSGWNDR